ncbi:MAG TPA: SUMF1/EgtB/PvdO family nonheme iron enzyme [Polyangiaceae bacterium]|nr:SUMF1/EgtB/PvdO family nonheme iron enzyme [Polyangiaceae bacterium]
MSRGIRLLLLGDAGGRVRELRVSRGLLCGVLVAALAGNTALCIGAFVLGTRASRIATRAAPAVSLVQQLKRPNAAPPPVPARAETPCPDGMVLVAGAYCPNVRQSCVKHVDPDGSVLRALRCAEYAEPSVCASAERQPLRFCIDREEYATTPHSKATNDQTVADAAAACKAQGKRLCSENEWTFACEGEAMLPYPYGFDRDGARCNTDQTDLVTPAGALRDLRAEPDAFPECVSPFGVHNLSGNVEEYVLASDGSPLRKGAYWQPGPANCRARQTHTDPSYAGVETGFRCCADPARP